MKTVMMILTMINLSLFANDFCDEALVEVIQKNAKSANMTDFRLTEDGKQILLRLGDQVRIIDLEGENYVPVAYSFPMDTLKEMCSSVECDEGMVELIAVSNSASVTEELGLSAMRFSENLDYTYVKVGQAVLLLNNQTQEFEDFLGNPSLNLEDVQKICL